MEIKHLRSFLAVAEVLSFIKAARKLHLSQPALSAQIRALEADVGVKLLERTRRSVRLTAGSCRELHWHTANEWAYMLNGNARVTVLNPDGTIFIGDVSEGDLWFFPAGYQHSIQGLAADGCEFFLVFDEGGFSEYQTFLISDWVAHTTPEVLAKNFQVGAAAVKKLPEDELYIFPGVVPGPLEDDKKAVGREAVMSKVDYTFRMKATKPNVETSGGNARIVDSSNLPASTAISAALVRAKPGGLRELHRHPNSSEWQYTFPAAAG